MSTFTACVPLLPDGTVGGGWGKAHVVAIAQIVDGVISEWNIEEVDWDALHDSGSEGSHHARIVRFLNDHKVSVVAAGHMGEGMQNTLAKMGITVHLGVSGDAKTALINLK